MTRRNVNFLTDEMACVTHKQACQKLRLSRGITIVSSERRVERYEIFSSPPARKFPPSLTKKYLMGVWMFRVTYDCGNFSTLVADLLSGRDVHCANDVPPLNNLANSINSMYTDSDKE